MSVFDVTQSLIKAADLMSDADDKVAKIAGYEVIGRLDQLQTATTDKRCFLSHALLSELLKGAAKQLQTQQSVLTTFADEVSIMATMKFKDRLKFAFKGYAATFMKNDNARQS